MNASPNLTRAPDLQVSRWFNTDQDITLSSLRGKVVVIEAFQMLCPGCVSHGLPQAVEIAGTFSPADVQVLGLHSVFEHHTAMQPHALKAFLHEYGIPFPVAVDAHDDAERTPIPKTMQAYALQGTPSLLVIDRAGHLRINHFGRVSDMRIAAEIAKLVYEAGSGLDDLDPDHPGPALGCTPDGGCR